MLPVINVGSNKRPTYLPSHVCQVRPGQISRLKLDPGQMIEMGRFAVRNPDENAKSISNKGFKTLGLTPDNKELVTLPPFGVIRHSYKLIRIETV